MDRFDEALVFAELNKDKSYTRTYSYGKNPYLNFIAYSILTSLERKDLKNNIEPFIRYFLDLNDRTDTLTGIISSDDETELKKAYIEFLYSDIDPGRPEIPKDILQEKEDFIKKETEKNKENEKMILRKIDAGEPLAIHGMNLQNGIIKKVHFNYLNKNSMNMFFMQGKGIFLSVSPDIHLFNGETTDSEEIGELLKTAGDPTRYKIIVSLIKNDLTTSELSRITGVSLSTVNYHLKQLISSGIVLVTFPGKSGKREIYTLNRDYINRTVDFIKLKINLK